MGEGKAIIPTPRGGRAPGLSILMYHGLCRRPPRVRYWCLVAEDRFRRQMRLIKQRFEVLPLSEAAARCRDGTLTRPAVAVTFDDGYYNNYSIGFPILRELGIPATIFLATGFVGADRVPWNVDLYLAVRDTEASEIEFEGRRLPLRTAGQRGAAFREIRDALKPRPPDRLDQDLRAVRRRLGLPESCRAAHEPVGRMLDPAAIRTMQESGLIEFGAHTVQHVILSRVPPARQREEINDSVAQVAAWTGRPCRLFAYPNGEAGDYDSATLQALADAGIEWAVTTQGGQSRPSTPPLELRRTGVGDRLPAAGLLWKLHRNR